jgi:hypothetical protein
VAPRLETRHRLSGGVVVVFSMILGLASGGYGPPQRDVMPLVAALAPELTEAADRDIAGRATRMGRQKPLPPKVRREAQSMPVCGMK